MANPNENTPTPGSSQSDHKDYAGSDREAQKQGQQTDRDRQSGQHDGDAQNSDRRDQHQQGQRQQDQHQQEQRR